MGPMLGLRERIAHSYGLAVSGLPPLSPRRVASPPSRWRCRAQGKPSPDCPPQRRRVVASGRRRPGRARIGHPQPARASSQAREHHLWRGRRRGGVPAHQAAGVPRRGSVVEPRPPQHAFLIPPSIIVPVSERADGHSRAVSLGPRGDRLNSTGGFLPLPSGRSALHGSVLPVSAPRGRDPGCRRVRTVRRFRRSRRPFKLPSAAAPRRPA